MDNQEDKIIIKKTGLPGVNLAMMDFGMVSSVQIKKTQSTRSIFKVKGKTFISTKEKLGIQDVIQTGKLKLKYRVIREERMSDIHWFTYQIKRIDNNPTTSLDINNSIKGGNIYIINRKSFEELFLEYPHINTEKVTCDKPSVPKVKCVEEITIPCASTVTLDCSSAKATLKNTNGLDISITTIGSGSSTTIIAPDGVAYNSDNSFTLNIPSGESRLIPDTVVNVEDTNGLFLGTGSFPSTIGGTIVVPAIVCADVTYLVQYVNGTVIDSGVEPSGGNIIVTVPDPITCDPVDININGIFWATILGGNTEDIPVVKSTGTTTVGSKQGSFWRIADSIVNIVNTAATALGTVTVQAESIGSFIAPDGIAKNIDNSYSVNVPSGATVTLPDTPVSVEDSLGNVLGGGTLPSITGGVVTVPACLDANYTVEYLNGTPIDSGTIPSGGSATIQVPNPIVCAPAIVENSSGVYSTTVTSGGLLVVPDTIYDVYVNGVFDQTVTLPSLENQTINITA